MAVPVRLLLLATVLGVSGYLFYTPVPKGYSPTNNIKILIDHARLRIVFNLATAGEFLGFGHKSELVQRAYFTLFDAKPRPVDGLKFRDTEFDSIPVRVYEPVSHKGKKLPGVVYYHGGGWNYQDVDSYHDFLVLLTERLNAVLVAVEYRLAPGSVFPAAHDDCLKATKYFIQRSTEFGVDPARLAIAGDSAGGNMAASIAVKLRDQKITPKIKVQFLIYPVTQAVDFFLPSMLEHQIGPILTRNMMCHFFSTYVTGNSNLTEVICAQKHIPSAIKERLTHKFIDVNKLPEKYLTKYEPHKTEEKTSDAAWKQLKEKILDPYLSPLLTPDLSKLPPAVVVTCDHDVLRDEGLLYVTRLQEAGNKVVHHNLETGFHGVMFFGIHWHEMETTLDEIFASVSSNL